MHPLESTELVGYSLLLMGMLNCLTIGLGLLMGMNCYKERLKTRGVCVSNGKDKHIRRAAQPVRVAARRNIHKRE